MIKKNIQGIFETQSLTKEQISQYIKTKNEINKDLKNNKSKYCRNGIAEKITKD